MTRSLTTRPTSIATAIMLLALTTLPGLARAADAVDAAAAKKEAKVVWYTSTPVKQAQTLAGMFEKQSGIKVELFRSGGSEVLRRFQQELSARRINADVMTNSDPAATALLAKRGAFVAFKPENFDKIPESARDKDGFWVAQRLNLITIYFLGTKVAEADRPKTWGDVLDAKYKGKLIMTDPSFTSVQVTVVGMTAKTRGWDFFEKLKKNDILIVRGNQQVADNIKRGERLIAVGALDTYAAADRKAGHPMITVFPADGTYIIPAPTAVIKGSPHPNAAKLFAQYLIGSEAQNLLPATGGYASRTDIAPPKDSPPVSQIKLLPVDYDYLEKSGQQIKKKFNEIFQ